MACAMRPTLLRQALAASSRPAMSPLSRAIPSTCQLQQRPALQIVQRAAFQTTAQRAILPPLPQRIPGGVNEAAHVPDPEPAHGSYHWSAERAVSAALIPLTIAPFAAGALYPTMDGFFIGLLIVHSHMGFQSSITDYLPKRRVPKTRKLFDYGTYLAILVVGWGWYEFETNDIGLTAAVARIWTAPGRKARGEQI